jgi:tRNA A-37 threonylcarbamoyl transferase component Bud32
VSPAPPEPARLFWELWQQGPPPDLAGFLERVGPLPPLDLAAVLRVDQRQRWLVGERPTAESYLRDHPGAGADGEAALDLIYGEFLLREELGEAPVLAEYLRRFPEHAAPLRIQVGFHEALGKADPSESGRPPTVPPGAAPVAPAPAVGSVDELLELLRRDRLLEPSRLAEAAGELRARFADARGLARELVRRGWLTPFQVNQLFQARGRRLVLGDYLLLERLGAGGMGEVFKARHQDLGRVVALKVLRKECLPDPEAVRRFRREVRAAARVDHPNVVRAYGAGRDGEAHFFVMEYVAGIDLARLVARGGRLPVETACEFARQAALGLQHAHEKGLVHRDVKPANLLLALGHAGSRPGDEVVKLADLGLARLDRHAPGQSSTRLTEESALVGTPDYIAPEQVRDAHAADIRSDLYSLGCTLYHLLAGRPPAPAGPLGYKLSWHQTGAPRPLRGLRPEVPEGVARVVEKLMARSPADRYQTPAEAAAALAAVLAEVAPAAPAPRRVGRWVWLLGAAAAGLVLAGAVLWALGGR